MKFLHTADVHLGAEPESSTGLGKIRQEEIWATFRKIINLCEQEQIDLLLLAGDLFHGQPLLREVKEVDYLFRQLTKTRVVMCAGNHDCLLATSHYYDVTFPEHVTFLMDTRADSVYLPELNTEVFGLSYETRQISEPRYDSIRISHPERINILLAHGNILCNDKSIPVHRSALEATGFDYVALGHLHNRMELGSRMAYSGCPEPLNRGETGPKGYIIGEIFKKGAAPSELSWNFIVSGSREYIPMELEVTTKTTELSLCEDLFSRMKEQGLKNMYLVTLRGTRSREVIWNIPSVISVLSGRGAHAMEMKDMTIPDFCVERLREEQRDTLVGRFIARMDEVTPLETKNLALHYGLQALLARDERK